MWLSSVCSLAHSLTTKLLNMMSLAFILTHSLSKKVLEMVSFASLLAADGGEEPLLVFPKAVSGINNIYNLTLALSGGGAHGNKNLSAHSGGAQGNSNNSYAMESSSPRDGQQTNKSQRQPSADLGQILSKGQISFSQLEYSKLLGKGNSGTGVILIMHFHFV